MAGYRTRAEEGETRRSWAVINVRSTGAQAPPTPGITRQEITKTENIVNEQIISPV